mgnify:CR=1 FL=1
MVIRKKEFSVCCIVLSAQLVDLCIRLSGAERHYHIRSSPVHLECLVSVHIKEQSCQMS